MKDAFPGHFANDPQDLQRLWERSLIAVDANVLLSLYRYSEGTRNEFLDVFEKLKDRLWIPHQVAKEYFKNRLKVISDQAKTYDSAIQGLTELRGRFEDSKQHPFVSLEVLGDCTRSFDLIIGELKENKGRHDSKINDDDIKEVVSRIFDGKVGAPYDSERLESILVMGADRYLNKVPPGFKDADKVGGASLEEKLAPYGDYIAWLQLLDKARGEERDIIYVTGDNKEDWWLKQSGRTVGPLPALIEEFIAVTSQRFYMYLPDRFLQRAGEYVQQAVSEQAMDEVREVRREELKEPVQAIPAPSIERWKGMDSYPQNFGKIHEYIKRWRTIYHDEEDSLVRRRASNRLHEQAAFINERIVEVSAEISQRVIDGPTEYFGGLSNTQLDTLLGTLRAELKAILQMIERMDLSELKQNDS